jgi:hypothetical protein
MVFKVVEKFGHMNPADRVDRPVAPSGRGIGVEYPLRFLPTLVVLLRVPFDEILDDRFEGVGYRRGVRFVDDPRID